MREKFSLMERRLPAATDPESLQVIAQFTDLVRKHDYPKHMRIHPEDFMILAEAVGPACVYKDNFGCVLIFRGLVRVRPHYTVRKGVHLFERRIFDGQA